ncbi:MAG: tetratricopeptide repeat protein [Gammaproteobacteria bacterium]|nr:tetratricopeptide repeat protein [Gammaproteobacteria bacterium]
MESNISEREQLDEIKKWWNANGKAIITGLALGLTALFGYRYWQDVQNSRAESASINYQHFLVLAAAGPSENAKATGQAIIEAEGSSVYARLTALQLARLAVEDDKLDEAKRHLNWIITNTPDSELSAVARSRLAQILLTEGNAAGAQVELDKIQKAGARALFAETRGDVFAALGKSEEAKVMYTHAIEKIVELGGDASLLEIKRDSLGVADITSAK